MARFSNTDALCDKPSAGTIQVHRAKVRTRIMGHLRQLMQVASVQEPARNIGGLKGSPLGWRMRR